LVGVRKVFDALSQSGVPLVGHNMFLDLCYIYQNFYKKLPATFEDFQAGLQNSFPDFYDSKYVAESSVKLKSNSQKFNTALQDLHEFFQQDDYSSAPHIVLGREFENLTENSYHQAGFDAYATGVCFLRSIAVETGHKKTRINLKDATDNYRNRIYIMNSCLPYIPLDGQTVSADYSNIFKLHRFPSSWKTGDIQQNLKDLGPFTVKWIDDQSCLLILRDTTYIPVARDRTKRAVKKSHKYVLEMYEDPTNSGLENSSGSKRKRESTEDSTESRKSKRANRCIIQ
jgi:hypothetical protein